MGNKSFLSLILIMMSCHVLAQQAVEVKDKDGNQVILYKKSDALVIGVSAYTNEWSSLPEVKEKVDGVEKILKQNGFNVRVVMDPKGEELRRSFMEFIAAHAMDKDTRVLFYFVGHGYTDGEMGYIIPVDTPNPNKDHEGFVTTAMDMSQIETYARCIQSKHALFIFESSLAASIFVPGESGVPEPISSKTREPVRQFIFSGSANEGVSEGTFFESQFVEALSGKADIDKDGYVTGTELGEYLQKALLEHTKNTQHLQCGKIKDSKLDKGDFVFQVPKQEVKDSSEEGSSLTDLQQKAKNIESLNDKLKQVQDTYKEVNESKTKTDVGTKIPVVDISRIDVKPGDVELKGEERIQFKAVGVRNSGEEVEIEVEWQKVSGGGKIETDGWYEAGDVSGICWIVAKDRLTGKESDPVKITIKSKDGAGIAETKPVEPEDLTKWKTSDIDESMAKPRETIANLPESNEKTEKIHVVIPVIDIEKVKTHYKMEDVERASKKQGFKYIGVNEKGYIEYVHEQTGIEMVLVPSGSFMMGSHDEEKDRDNDEGPVHEVYLDAYLISKYEVTNKLYLKFVSEKGNQNLPEWMEPGSTYNVNKGFDDHYKKLGEDLKDDNNPVVGVSWGDAKAFCEYSGLLLPTEAQWENAARAGTYTRFYWGDDKDYKDIGDYAWYNENSVARTRPVGMKKPNALGLYDMSGNVWEWCLDWKEAYPRDKQTNPIGPKVGTHRVCRGGSWCVGAKLCRHANRSSLDPETKNNNLGFRVISLIYQ